MDNGELDIFIAERYLRESWRLNYELPKSFMDFWETRLGPPKTAYVFPAAVDKLGCYLWRTAATP
eukprot:6455083-Prymnesium_polylepis.1